MTRRFLLGAGLVLLSGVAACHIGDGSFGLRGSYSEHKPGDHIKRIHVRGKGSVKTTPNGIEVTGTDENSDIEIVDEQVGPGGETTLDIAAVGSVTISPH